MKENKRIIGPQFNVLKLERWQGPPNINKVKQYEIVLSFKVSFYIQSFSVFDHDNHSVKKCSHLINSSALKLHSAPSNW